MTKSLLGVPTLPQDQFEFNQTQFFINYDRKEQITAWNYHSDQGEMPQLDVAGHSIIGLSLGQAWLLSASFDGLAHGIYWQLGRLLGYWQQSHSKQYHHDLICRCFGVTRSEILKSVIEKGTTSVGDIGGATKAGLGCAQCHQDIIETVQTYCDQNSFVIANKTKPKGLNPINLLIKMPRRLSLWNEAEKEKLELKFIGIKDYTVFASWPAQQDDLLERFSLDLKRELDLQLKWQRVSS